MDLVKAPIEEQNKLSLAAEAFLRERGVYVEVGPQQAYVEYVRYLDEDERDPKLGKLIRLVYIALTNGGIKVEGEEFPAFSPTADEAIGGYIWRLNWYLGGCKHLVWRQLPELHVMPSQSNHPDRWAVYSRLAVYT